MKLYFKQPITDSAKLKFLDFNLKNDGHKSGKIIKDYCEQEIRQGFINIDLITNSDTIEGLKALDIWEEPEPNYNEWIGEDCVFSDFPIKKDSEVFSGILKHITKENYFTINYDRTYLHCMLKKDYVKLLKEQTK